MPCTTILAKVFTTLVIQFHGQPSQLDVQGDYYLKARRLSFRLSKSFVFFFRNPCSTS